MGAVVAPALIIAASACAMVFAIMLWKKVAAVSLDYRGSHSTMDMDNELADVDAERGNALSPMAESFQKLRTIYSDIRTGARAFLYAEYLMCAAFLLRFGHQIETSGELLLFVLVSRLESGWDFQVGLLTALAFCVGGVTSMVAGYVGMMVAVFANARTTVSAMERPDSRAWTASFNCAFRAGGVMGYALAGVGLLTLYVLISVYAAIFDVSLGTEEALRLFECVAGFGLGGSAIALFGRVG